VKLYAETSAVLAWLLGEARGDEVRRELAAAEGVVSSDLTLVESDRVLIRAVALGETREAQAARRRAVLARAAARWTLLRFDAATIDRARRPFPVEPIRTLDAFHLAFALRASAAIPGLSILSLDAKVRDCAVALGFDVQPR
jgi:predicted nucleic acid-binding protein